MSRSVPSLEGSPRQKLTGPEKLIDLANRLDGYIEFRDRAGDTNVHQIGDIPAKLRGIAVSALPSSDAKQSGSP